VPTATEWPTPTVMVLMAIAIGRRRSYRSW